MKTTNARKTIWVMAVVLSVASSTVLGDIYFADGDTHNIDYEINDWVTVDQWAPGMRTRVNLLDGGSLSYPFDLRAYEDSQINILGGSIGRYFFPDGNSQVEMSGGSIGSDMAVGGSSQVDMSGGSIGGYLRAYDYSQVNISGGSIGSDLVLTEWAILTINGSNFAVDGQLFGYGELTSILGGSAWDEPRRLVTGTLASGEPINNDFYIGYDAKIALVPAPGAVLLGSIGLSFVGWLLRRKTVSVRAKS